MANTEEGICQWCGQERLVIKTKVPSPMPETFYQMFPEERGKPHPESFSMCMECMLRELG